MVEERSKQFKSLARKRMGGREMEKEGRNTGECKQEHCWFWQLTLGSCSELNIYIPQRHVEILPPQGDGIRK
jgi:hypothetical protein